MSASNVRTIGPLISPYSPDEFRKHIFSLNPPTKSLIEALYRRKLEYFDEYFAEFIKNGEGTIVTEEEYVDSDYSDDYSNHYSKCFNADYSKPCKRLHFFAARFTEVEFFEQFNSFPAEFQKSIGSEQPTTGAAHMRIASLSDLAGSRTCGEKICEKWNYLGFVVIKPLPSAVFGRTCLKTYGPNGSAGERHFPGQRKYRAHLCGASLVVRTLAWQEQDAVVAACATSALWSAFQKTGQHFHHRIPTPVQITMADGVTRHNKERAIPSKGLSVQQISEAIKNVRLEPELIEPKTIKDFLSACYAYVRGEIPVLAGVRIILDEGTSPSQKRFKPGWNLEGLHALTVAGYCIGEGAADKCDTTGELRLKSYAVSKLYAHDDGIGPFARLERIDDANDSKIRYYNPDRDTVMEADTMRCGWKPSANDIPGRIGPLVIVIPLHPIIRVSYPHVLTKIRRTDSTLRRLSRFYLAGEPVWDVFLDNADNAKASAIMSATISDLERKRVLRSHFPRYVWRARCFVDQTSTEPAFEIIYDATDSHMSDYSMTCIGYSRVRIEHIAAAIRSQSAVTLLSGGDPANQSATRQALASLESDLHLDQISDLG